MSPHKTKGARSAFLFVYMNSNLFNINWKDLIHSALTAVYAAVIVTLYKLVIVTGFDVFSVDWIAVGHSVVNAVVIAFFSVLGIRFTSDSEGKVLGKIG